ncbi:MAG: DUF721 domain-containing protein [Calditrichaeota bacterium]|nr:DUF721 domain-containing protein [Calditrichota bacterium]
MKHEPEKIGKILEFVLKDINALEDFTKLNILNNWETLVDKKISRICHPVQFEGNILVLEAISEGWKKELLKIKFEIIRILKSKFKQLKIEDIKIL